MHAFPILFLLFMLSECPATKNAPCVDCQAYGKDLYCTTRGAEDRVLLPLWILHTKKKFGGYGLSFHTPAPKEWTTVTVYFPASAADEEEVMACFEVSLVDGKAMTRKECELPAE